jgi:regulator of nonsense transcripts 2
MEARIRNIRFLSELTKFNVTPPRVIFHCVWTLLNDFSHESIEVLCNLLETCGRFLYKSPATHASQSSMVSDETLMIHTCK